MTAPADPSTGWTPRFPADRLREAGSSLAAAVACDGSDRHPLTLPLGPACGVGVTGLALIALDVHLHYYGRGFATGIGLAALPALLFLFNRWVAGPVLYYRKWGRLHRLDLTSVTDVDAGAKAGAVSLLLSAPALTKPMRVVVLSRGYMMSTAAREHLQGWLSSPQVHWTPQAEALLAEHGSGAALVTRRRRFLVLRTLTFAVPLAVLGVALVHYYRHQAARAIPGAPGYRRFGGPRGKLLPVGRPWGHPCQPIRFAVEAHVPDAAYSQIQAVVSEARRDGIDVTLETRTFRWLPSALYYVDGQSAATTVRVDIYAHDEAPPRHSDGTPLHINLRWNAQLDPDGRHEDLSLAEADLYMQTVAGNSALVRLSMRQLIAMTQGIIKSTRKDSGIPSTSTLDRFTHADVAAMKLMSGCPA
jgi:hypothetical protein